MTTQGDERSNKNNHPFFGYSAEDVDSMAADGMTAEEIEALFCGERRW